MIKTIGIVAGDAECYDTFRAAFDPVIEILFGIRQPAWTAKAPDLLSVCQSISQDQIDPDNQYGVQSRICLTRSIKAFRLPPGARYEERREIEKLMVGVCKSLLSPELQGEYLPLVGSKSYTGIGIPGDRNSDYESEPCFEQRLQEAGIIFEAPDSLQHQAAGITRDWPDARGVFVSTQPGLAVFINEEEHIRIVGTRNDASLQQLFTRVCALESALGVALDREGEGFDFNRLGSVASCPSNLGTGLSLKVLLKLPKLSKDIGGLKATAKELNLLCRCEDKLAGVWEFSLNRNFRLAEAELVETLRSGCKALVHKESKMD